MATAPLLAGIQRQAGEIKPLYSVITTPLVPKLPKDVSLWDEQLKNLMIAVVELNRNRESNLEAIQQLKEKLEKVKLENVTVKQQISSLERKSLLSQQPPPDDTHLVKFEF